METLQKHNLTKNIKVAFEDEDNDIVNNLLDNNMDAIVLIYNGKLEIIDIHKKMKIKAINKTLQLTNRQDKSIFVSKVKQLKATVFQTHLLAKDNINTMMNIISEFLTGQDNADGISATLEELAVADLIANVVNQNEIAAQHKNIEIITDYQADVLILADEKRLNQVMNNIISNAIKYSPKNSHVTIRTSYNEETWRLEVQDSGAGIPESERQYLFQAFSKSQISTEPTDGESSTGLGLWIASEMMRVQNGTIGMDTPASGGCCFWIELPHIQETVIMGV